METIYDFVTVGLFVAIIGMYFHFNQKEDQDLKYYILPSIGLAIANQVGNDLSDIAAIAMIGAIVYYLYAYIYNRGGISEESDPQ